MTREEMRTLVDWLNDTAYKYYTLSQPVVSDKEWDAEYDRLVQGEKETGIVLPDSPTHRVGSAPLTGFDQHTHIARLWSMGKAQKKEEVLAWLDRAEKLRQQANAEGAGLPPLSFVV